MTWSALIYNLTKRNLRELNFYKKCQSVNEGLLSHQTDARRIFDNWYSISFPSLIREKLIIFRWKRFPFECVLLLNRKGDNLSFSSDLTVEWFPLKGTYKSFRLMTFSKENYLRSKLQNKRNCFSPKTKTKRIRTNEIVLTMNLEDESFRGFHNRTWMSATKSCRRINDYKVYLLKHLWNAQSINL